MICSQYRVSVMVRATGFSSLSSVWGATSSSRDDSRFDGGSHGKPPLAWAHRSVNGKPGAKSAGRGGATQDAPGAGHRLGASEASETSGGARASPGVTPLEGAPFVLAHATPDSRVLTGLERPRQARL